MIVAFGSRFGLDRPSIQSIQRIVDAVFVVQHSNTTPIFRDIGEVHYSSRLALFRIHTDAYGQEMLSNHSLVVVA
jgi:hypothetical protein